MSDKPEELTIYEDTPGPVDDPEMRRDAGRRLVELTREHMARTGERDFAKASYAVAIENPELVKAYVKGGFTNE